MLMAVLESVQEQEEESPSMAGRDVLGEMAETVGCQVGHIRAGRRMRGLGWGRVHSSNDPSVHNLPSNPH